MDNRNLSNYNWLAAKVILGTCEGVLIPLGSTEQHGCHLPLSTDTVICEAVVKCICESKNLYYIPIIPYTQTWSSSDYSGTIHITENKIVDYVIDVVISLIKCNPKRIFLYSFHQGNTQVIKSILRYFYEKYDNLFYVYTNDLLAKCEDFVEKIKCGIWHASEIETSLLLYLNANLVNTDRYINFDPDELPPNREVKWKEFNIFGSYGNLKNSSKEKGERIFSIILEDLSKQIDELPIQKQKIDVHLFATDLDNTILDSHEELLVNTQLMLSKLHDKTRICFVSGRYEKMIEKYIDSVRLCDYVVSCNGAFIRDCATGEIVYKKTMNQQLAKEVISIIDRDGYLYVVYTESCIYYKQNLLKAKEKINQVQEFYQKSKNQTIKAVEISQDISIIDYDEILKIVIYEKDNIQVVVKKISNDLIRFEQTGKGLLSLFSAEVSKGDAIKFLQDILNCTKKQTMVCGDYINDLSMFDVADYRVAVANAHPEVLAKANIIVASNDEEGIAKFIKEELC